MLVSQNTNTKESSSYSTHLHVVSNLRVRHEEDLSQVVRAKHLRHDAREVLVKTLRMALERLSCAIECLARRSGRPKVQACIRVGPDMDSKIPG